VVIPLVEWGRLIGVGDPLPATSAELQITITVELQVGSLPAGTQLLNADNGITYITTAVVLLNAPTVSANIRAAADQADGDGSGSQGNLTNGSIVSFANPLANVARDAVVTSTVVTGADAETTESYRHRITERFQAQPQGGAYADYEMWGDSIAGIVHAYPYTSDCPGQVDVYVEATPASSGSPDGIPTTPQLQAVLDAINYDSGGMATRRPANALANTFPISRLAFDVNVSGLVVDNLAAVQAEITSALTEYFVSREPYIIGLSIPPRNDRITSSAVAGIVDDVVSSAGGLFVGISITRLTIPILAYSLGAGEKAKLGASTFI
jgi:uncharacterized phage protein gp47/JayE